MKGDSRDMIGSILSLFFSSSTLVCCALPALLISLGAGATFAWLTATMPGIVWLSNYKDVLFTISVSILLVSTYSWWNQRKEACPIDTQQARSCIRFRRLNLWLLVISWLTIFFGFFFAYGWTFFIYV